MKSTSFNLGTTMNKLEINLLEVIENEHMFDIQYVFQEEYDLLTSYDERTVYIIKDSKSPRMYIGRNAVPINTNDRQYLIGFNPYTCKYIIYLNIVSGKIDHNVPICEYNDPQQAINALIVHSHIGDHDKVFMKILKVLEQYIEGNVGMNTTLISFISVLGYRDDLRLQYLNELSIKYDDDQAGRDISQFHREMLHNEKYANKNSLVALYSDIYDLFVEFDFFKQYKSIDDIETSIIQSFSKKLLTAARSYKM